MIYIGDYKHVENLIMIYNYPIHHKKNRFKIGENLFRIIIFLNIQYIVDVKIFNASQFIKNY